MKYIVQYNYTTCEYEVVGFTSENVSGHKTVVYDENDNVVSTTFGSVTSKITWENGDVETIHWPMEDENTVYETKEAALEELKTFLTEDLNNKIRIVESYNKTIDNIRERLAAL